MIPPDTISTGRRATDPVIVVLPESSLYWGFHYTSEE